MPIKKVKIAISACLLGQRVRYDGREKIQAHIVDCFFHEFTEKVDVIPFCPEVAIGLGVPRPKIQVVRKKDQRIRILGVEDYRWDVTDALKLYAEDFLQLYPDISHFVVKSKSPSCGYQSTALYEREVIKRDSGHEMAQPEQHYRQIGLVSGLFVQTILELKPQLHISDETCLSTKQACLHLLQQIENLNP